MNVEVISVPFDLCGPHHGSRLGSIAMQMAELEDSLTKLDIKVSYSEAYEINGKMPGSREECDGEALKVYSSTKSLVAKAIKSGNIPLTIGGDHSLSIGSISGALEVYGSKLAVIWIDAHMDANTPDTTPSGNLHGVPLGVLTKLPIETDRSVSPFATKPWFDDVHQLWPKLLEGVPGEGLSKDKVCWIGLRDVDPGEVRNLGKLPGSKAITMQEVDWHGLKSVMDSVHRWIIKSGAEAVWVSFDVDCLDPIFAPGTGTAVRGGFTYREGHLIAESLFGYFNMVGNPYVLAGLDVVEVNPLRDNGNATAKVAVEWLSSFFGKTIMHEREQL